MTILNHKSIVIVVLNVLHLKKKQSNTSHYKAAIIHWQLCSFMVKLHQKFKPNGKTVKTKFIACENTHLHIGVNLFFCLPTVHHIKHSTNSSNDSWWKKCEQLSRKKTVCINKSRTIKKDKCWLECTKSNVHYHHTIENCIRHLVAKLVNMCGLRFNNMIWASKIDTKNYILKNYLLIFRLIDKIRCDSH